MAAIDGQWLINDTVKDNHIELRNNQALGGRNLADTAKVPMLKLNTSDLPEFITQPQFVGVPTVDSDLVNKGYVIDVLAGLRDPKDACRVASTANVVIATGTLLTIDGVVLIAGDRVLLKDQTVASENGIYIAGIGAWARSTDADQNAEVTQGLSTLILEGTKNARKQYSLVTSDPIIVGTTALSLVQVPNPANFLVPEFLPVTLAPLDISNGYIDLPHKAEAKSINLTPKGGPKQEQLVDYTVSVVGNVSRITFAGDFATRVLATNVLLIDYAYATA